MSAAKIFCKNPLCNNLRVRDGWCACCYEAASSAAVKFPSDRQYHECDNCGKEFAWKLLKPIQNLTERLDAGGTVPTGECPDCGALCYPVVVKEPDDELLTALKGMLEWARRVKQVNPGLEVRNAIVAIENVTKRLDAERRKS